MAIQRIDLNLFKVFEAVLHSHSVSGASRELGVTASAVSHALGRLRQALGDELFVYGEDGMVPTPRALEIAPAVREGLGRLGDAISIEPFDPQNCARTFRISATDYGSIAIVTPLVAHLARTAPHLDLRIFPYSRMDVVRHLDEGRIDLILGWFGDLPDRARRTQIALEQESLIVRVGHPLTEGVVTRQRLFSYPFMVVELTGSGSPGSDGFLDERGVWRRVWIDRLLIETGSCPELGARVALSLPHYGAVSGLLAQTDMVATLPARMAQAMVAAGTHQILDLPYKPLEVTVEAIWHERAERDPAVQWLLGELVFLMENA